MKIQFQLLLFYFAVITGQAKAQCNASFTYTVGSNNTVTFQSTSAPTNSTTSFSWAFGDTFFGNGPTVVHQYSSLGVYTVTLNIITSSPSCSATVSQTINISSSCPLSASFTYTNNGGGNVNFQSTSVGTSSILNYYWAFGDGASGTGASTSHTYPMNGTYAVNLLVYDSLNFCSDSVSVPVTISGLPCNMNPNYTYSVYMNGVVWFNNSTNPLLPSNTYTWNFGDGSAPNYQTTPSHVYSSSGTYTVSLSAAQGTCTTTYTNAVSVTYSPCALNAAFTFTSGPNGQVSFSTTTGLSPSTLTSWFFGDGTNAVNITNPVHNYIANGTYNVWLSLTDTVTTCFDSSNVMISVTNVTCGLNSAQLNFNNNQFFNGTTTFYSNIPNTNVVFFWDFGNGSTSSAASPTTTYAASGNYLVSYTVTDASNLSCFATYSNNVNITYVPCNYTASFTNTLTGTTVSVTSTSAGTNSNTLYIWNWGDGNTTSGGQATSATHVYAFNGTYYISLQLVDSINNFTNFCSDSTGMNITITGGMPCPVSSAFTLQKDTTQLYNWFVYPNYTGPYVSAVWSWGDGSSSNSLFTSHTYSAAGWYNICLTLSLSCGSQSTTCYNSYLNKTSDLSSAIINIQVVNSPNGISERNMIKDEILIYPNPGNGKFHMKLYGNLSKTYDLSAYNSIGENVFDQKIKFDKDDTEVDLSMLREGCYFILLKGELNSYRKTIIIKTRN